MFKGKKRFKVSGLPSNNQFKFFISEIVKFI